MATTVILPGVPAAGWGVKRAASTALGMTEILPGAMQARRAVFSLLQWETQITCRPVDALQALVWDCHGPSIRQGDMLLDVQSRIVDACSHLQHTLGSMAGH